MCRQRGCVKAWTPAQPVAICVLLLLVRGSLATTPACKLSQTNGSMFILDNGFVYAELSLAPPALVDLRGDFAGQGLFTVSSLRAPLRLQSSIGGIVRSSDADAVNFTIVANSSNSLWIRLHNVTDAVQPVAREDW